MNTRICNHLELPTIGDVTKNEEKWKKVLAEPMETPTEISLEDANAFVNSRIKYKREHKDEWRVLPEYGDCEDYAISKYKILVNVLGPERLRFLVGHMHGRPHALLAVRADEKWCILDCFTDQIYTEEDYRGFEPIWGATDKRFFIYVKTRPGSST